MLNPLLTMAILGFVFSHLMRFDVPNYTLFLLSGILAWNLFSQGLVMGTNSILGSASLLKKVKVPATVFPAAVVGSVLVNFVLALIPYFIISIYMGLKPGIGLIALPVVLLPLLLFTYGAGLLLASLNVRFRDVSHVLEPITSMLFYGTPILYPIDRLPEKFQALVWLNPMSSYIEAIRQSMFEGVIPSLALTGRLYLMAGVMVLIGYGVYRKMSKTFVFFF